jgi:RimJ/RimL family protein N-acetyltransferase
MAGDSGMAERFGEPVGDWRAPPRPKGDVLQGRWVRVEALDPARHADDLHRANSADDRIWDYLPYGPFASADAYRQWADGMAASADPLFHALIPLETGRAAGVASYLRITPEAGSIEVGHICLSPAIQRSPAATEAMFLMADWAFRAGYRRYEWKCNALNLASRRAAARLGFSYEGTFRQAAVVKGRNRDTAWFAIIDKDWPALRKVFLRWLDPANFGSDGAQKTSLSALTRPLLFKPDTDLPEA